MTEPSGLREIVVRLGGDLYSGGTRACVPGPGHSKRDRSLSLRLMPSGRLVWHSFVPADPDEVCKHLGLDGRPEGKMSASEALQAQREYALEQRAANARRIAFCREIWRSTQSAEGSPVETYLRDVRAIRAPIPPVLRYGLAVPVGYRSTAPRLPAMVALAQRPDGLPAGLHITFIRPDGSEKAALPNPRRMFWSLEGGGIRLSHTPRPGASLAVAEGVETALSFRDRTGEPTWAAGSAVGLSQFIPPTRLSRLIVAADADDGGAGLVAARELAARARRWCDVTLAPAPAGKDWNTVAMEGRHELDL